MDGYAYFEPIPEIDPEDIYIGSYGYDSGDRVTNIIPINQELKDLLAGNCEEADLNEFELLNG
ncbi:hypothetical protein [Vibrio metoecus]|nr:hypothetical protein [Vibrio metoecus]WKY95352.1 hypothetical protein QYQ96_15825 [Vibrio metoecus]